MCMCGGGREREGNGKCKTGHLQIIAEHLKGNAEMMVVHKIIKYAHNVILIFGIILPIQLQIITTQMKMTWESIFNF